MALDFEENEEALVDHPLKESIEDLTLEIEKLAEVKQYDEELKTSIEGAVKGLTEAIASIKPEANDDLTNILKGISKNAASLEALITSNSQKMGQYDTVIEKILMVIQTSIEAKNGDAKGIVDAISGISFEIPESVNYKDQFAEILEYLKQKSSQAIEFTMIKDHGRINKVIARPIE